MQNLPALGTGPVSFVDSTGNQFEIPLSLISFDSSNKPSLESGAPAAYADPSVVGPGGLLQTLAAQGLIFPGPPPQTSTTTPP